jgi:hypothetical protein
MTSDKPEKLITITLPDQWEYLCRWIPADWQKPGVWAAECNDLGAQGWELVQMHFVQHYNTAPPGDRPSLITIHDDGFHCHFKRLKL